MTNQDFRDARKRYEDDRVVVYWEPELCAHTGYCVRALPTVFRPKDKPWIQIWAEPGSEGADRIAAAVRQCPTGALHYERIDGGEQEQPPTPPTVAVVPNGPLVIRGEIDIPLGPPGTSSGARRAYRCALCRCGGSHRMPFCDGSHRSRTFDDAAGQPAGSITGE